MSKFRANPNAGRQLAADPQHRLALRQAAEEVAEAARQAAPDGGPHRGYRETIRVREMATAVRVESTDIAAHLVEWGSSKNPPYAPLRRGVRAAGLRLDET